jgi:hypothetical protein
VRIALLSLLVAGSSVTVLADRDETAALVDGAELGERLAAGPTVVLGQVVKQGARERVAIERVYRGSGVEAMIKVDDRQVNSLRQVNAPPFRIELGERAVLVLEPAVDTRDRPLGDQIYQPAIGYRSKVPIPPEGGQAVLDAVREIVFFQDRPDRGVAEAELVDWLTGRNPWLVDYAVSHAARFEAAGPDWIPGLVGLTRSANPWHRARAVTALGGALARGRLESRSSDLRLNPLASEETNELLRISREAIVRLARTDPESSVRIAAIRRIPACGHEQADEILEAIGREDPDQAVRYEAAAAERILRER